VNKFVKVMLKLKAGEGPIKKKDVQEDLDDNGDLPPEIYEQEELDKFYAGCRNGERTQHRRGVGEPPPVGGGGRNSDRRGGRQDA
jgi:hypothetical protein